MRYCCSNDSSWSNAFRYFCVLLSFVWSIFLRSASSYDCLLPFTVLKKLELKASRILKGVWKLWYSKTFSALWASFFKLGYYSKLILTVARRKKLFSFPLPSKIIRLKYLWILVNTHWFHLFHFKMPLKLVSNSKV